MFVSFACLNNAFRVLWDAQFWHVFTNCVLNMSLMSFSKPHFLSYQEVIEVSLGICFTSGFLAVLNTVCRYLFPGLFVCSVCPGHSGGLTEIWILNKEQALNWIWSSACCWIQEHSGQSYFLWWVSGQCSLMWLWGFQVSGHRFHSTRRWFIVRMLPQIGMKVLRPLKC